MNIRTISLLACLAVSPLSTGLAHATEITQTDPTAFHAEEQPGTLEKIKKTGTITVGYHISSIPFSYLDASLQPTGYSKELCDLIVDAIKKELHIPNLKTTYALVEIRSRIPMLLNNTIDLECSASSNIEERRKTVSFSITYFISHIRLLARKDHHFKGLSDLANKTIVVTTGTTAERAIQKKLDIDRLNATIMQSKNHLYSFMMLKSGRAAAYAMDEALLAGLIASARDPNAYEIIGPSLSMEHYAVMMRRDEPLRTLVNKALKQLIESGTVAKLYDRWFMQPIPPSGINLKMPMTPEQADALARPAETGETPP